MYLYYDKTRTLKTAIAHGEPIRQNSDINIFVCLDDDYFSYYGISDEVAKTSELAASVTYENGKFGAESVPSENVELETFEKINSSEMTYYLQSNKEYWTYKIKFDYKEITIYPGKIYFNLKLIVDGQVYSFGTAELYVEARTGLPSVDDSITQIEYDEIVMRMNKISNRVTILEKKGVSSGESEKITDLTNTEWTFKENINFYSLLQLNESITYNLNFISNEMEWEKINIAEGTDTIGYNMIQYINNSIMEYPQVYLDYDGDGVPGWENPNGGKEYKKIKINGGQDIKDGLFIDWLYENANLTGSSGGSSSGGNSDLILDDYYDKTQSNEIFATKQELLEQINKILGEGTIEQLDTIKEIATAIGNNPNFYKEISQLIQNKADSSTVTEIQGIVNQNKDDVNLIKLKNESQDGILAEQSRDIQDLKTLKNDFDNVEIADAADIDRLF